MRSAPLLLAVLMIFGALVCGCTSQTDYRHSGGVAQDISTPATTPAANETSEAKYVRGDIVQPDQSDESFSPNIGAVILGVEEGTYLFHMVRRDSPNSPWEKAAGYEGSTTFDAIENIFPHKIGHVDPDTLVIAETPTATPTKATGRERLKILSHDLEYSDFGTTYVVGKAKNVGDSRISWGSVEVKFYDSDEALIGNSLDTVHDLDPGETWKFKAMYFDIDGAVESYKIGVGTVW